MPISHVAGEGALLQPQRKSEETLKLMVNGDSSYSYLADIVKPCLGTKAIVAPLQISYEANVFIFQRFKNGDL